MATRASRVGSVIDNALLGTCFLGSLILLFLPVQLRDRSAAALRRTIVAPFAELQRRAELMRAAFVSYDERMDRLAQITRLQIEYSAVRSENERLRKTLSLGSRLSWGFVAAEATPAQLESDLVSRQILQTFSVTAGSRAGIQPFTPVINADGLVGMVQTADASSSIAISYAHPDFRVSATTPNDSAFGVVQARLGSGKELGLLEMRGVPFRSPLKAGQLIISSGLGGTYPRGIPVGTVIREVSTPEKWARTYLLQPAASLANLGPVFMLLKKRSDEGVTTIWMSQASADSAARAIAAGGDSLARVAAEQEMAARRAALDSLGREQARADSAAAPRPVPPQTTPAATPPSAAPRPAAAAPSAAPPRPTTTTTPTSTTPAPRPATADTAGRTARPTVPRPTVPRPTVPVPGAHL
ncbi:Rod shape-determining protein MreC [Gemmatirosa kalamazoonensis]|uniref:Cell shape-determining protein MreC n=1 Tax=Gemmatirosa kalamazoonensis TaxID=861299 RepID=W0RIK6_9BACT|nr:rod shape-determining protein MreC [Gemmatirosa kalamazoonensis]AHG90934.1 Rod shape-determining protein MreC [Gemmatirosa kalamazoonensis]